MFERFQERFDRWPFMAQSYAVTAGIVGGFMASYAAIAVTIEQLHDHPRPTVAALVGAVTVAKVIKIGRTPTENRARIPEGHPDVLPVDHEDRVSDEDFATATADLRWCGEKLV
jgi:hypothetical protein